MVEDFGKVMYVLLYLKWITNKNLLYIARGTLLNVMWMGGESGGEWICVYVRLSPSSVHMKLPQHCSSAIPQYKIKS